MRNENYDIGGKFLEALENIRTAEIPFLSTVGLFRHDLGYLIQIIQLHGDIASR